jgi:hypothetical protein
LLAGYAYGFYPPGIDSGIFYCRMDRRYQGVHPGLRVLFLVTGAQSENQVIGLLSLPHGSAGFVHDQDLGGLGAAVDAEKIKRHNRFRYFLTHVIGPVIEPELVFTHVKGHEQSVLKPNANYITAECT